MQNFSSPTARHSFVVGLSAFGAALFIGMAGLPIACLTRVEPNDDHCQNNKGDTFCQEKYPDVKEHRWFCELSGCWSMGRSEDGCVAEIPERKDECYKPCGGGVSWQECLDTMETTTSSTGTDTDTSTEITDTGSTTGSESETSETSGGVCGNGMQEGMEACDDGNDDNTDACIEGCKAASCGDSFVWADMEECDDGDEDNTDECVEGCKVASCGDGFVWAGMEACDDGNLDNGDGCSATCTKECGDGMWNAELEECDDGNDMDGDGCSAACKDEQKVVFVTSMPTPSGNLGGISGADGICQTAADSVNLQGTFRAWLSDDTGSPSTWTENKPTLPYVRMDGKQVASSWADLVDGSDLANTINVTENNMPVGNNIFVWTNTTPEGILKNDMTDCTDWTNEDGLDIGGQGLSSQTNSTWTQVKMPDTAACSDPLHHLYCFEQ